MKFAINKASATYTGGGIWIFEGSFTNGYYFLTDDDGNTIILTHSASDLNVSCDYTWQQEHKAKDLEGGELKAFLSALVRFMKYNKSFEKGGFTDSDIDVYAKYWEVSEAALEIELPKRAHLKSKSEQIKDFLLSCDDETYIKANNIYREGNGEQEGIIYELNEDTFDDVTEGYTRLELLSELDKDFDPESKYFSYDCQNGFCSFTDIWRDHQNVEDMAEWFLEVSEWFCNVSSSRIEEIVNILKGGSV